MLRLLVAAPTHGYELKQRFERAVGGIWPLNVGQVYDALGKLERDGLAEPVGDDAGTRRVWRATTTGAEAARRWAQSPPTATPPPRDDLAVRVLVEQALDGDVQQLLDAQRAAAIARIQHLGRDRTAATATGDDARALLLDLVLLRADADVRWLDRVEARLTTTKESR